MRATLKRATSLGWDKAKGEWHHGPTGNRGLMLTLPVPPSANRWWRLWRNRMVLSLEARQYKAALSHVLFRVRSAMIRPPQTVSVTLFWFRQRKQGDLDKRFGVALDALQGLAYLNDSQVIRIVADRVDCSETEQARLEVFVSALGTG